jgi:hypothetical protein
VKQIPMHSILQPLQCLKAIMALQPETYLCFGQRSPDLPGMSIVHH